MRALFSLTALLLWSVSTVEAQSLYTYDVAATAIEHTGPPGGPCAYPNGPIVSGFPAIAGPCVAPGPALPPLGDVTVDVTTNLVYVSDGPLIGVYTTAGVHLGSHPSPLAPITGMGVDGVAGLLWITDGIMYGALPLPLPLCGPIAPFAVGPFPAPIGAFFAAPLGGLDWDPITGTLWGCDFAGLVGNFFPGPASPPGPFGLFPVPPLPCPLVPPLLGIAVDRAGPAGLIYVTDGVTVSHMLPGGAPAPPTFYTPVPCYPVPAPPPVAGLAFTGHQITYGVGGNNLAGPIPVIGSIGNSYPGNPAYGVTLSGATPGSVAYLKFSMGSSCPPLPVLGVPVYIAVPRFTATVMVVGGGGTAAFASPIPAAFPVGLPVHLQWAVLSFPGLAVTSGARLTLVAP